MVFCIFQKFLAISICFYSQSKGCKIYNRLSLFFSFQEALSLGMKFSRFSLDLCFLRENVPKVFSLFLSVETELKTTSRWKCLFVVSSTSMSYMAGEKIKGGVKGEENLNNPSSYFVIGFKVKIFKYSCQKFYK